MLAHLTFIDKPAIRASSFVPADVNPTVGLVGIKSFLPEKQLSTVLLAAGMDITSHANESAYYAECIWHTFVFFSLTEPGLGVVRCSSF